VLAPGQEVASLGFPDVRVSTALLGGVWRSATSPVMATRLLIAYRLLLCQVVTSCIGAKAILI
jgi:hypothetical protein